MQTTSEGFPLAGLKSEIAQSLPFASAEEEAILNLLRTSDCLERAFHHKTRRWGLTSTQYNVLRILRGAQPDGLPCTAIGERMIAAEPDITRLLGRLKGLKLVQQRRDPRDRRVVLTQITGAGLEILRAMDPVIRRLPRDLLGHMSADELQQLIRMLESARLHCCETHAQQRAPAVGKTARSA
jgi:DNA-binding MarR family transcriptional regulator